MMASFSAFGGDFPSIALIVLHSLEGFVLGSSVSTNCLHVFLRCSFVVLVISSFICCRAGAVGSLDLRYYFQYFHWYRLCINTVSSRCYMPLWCVQNDGTHDLFAFLGVCWKPSFAQFILYLVTISVPVCFL